MADPKAPPTIAAVYVFDNGMVMTFDQYDQQMPEYQGPWDEMRREIRMRYKGPIVATSWSPLVVAAIKNWEGPPHA